MSVNSLTGGNDDGTNLGDDTSDKIAFFGSTPVVQHSSDASVDALTTLSAVSGDAAGIFGLSSLSAMENLLNTVKDMRDALQTFGLIS